MDQRFVQLDETEDMVPGDGQYRAEKEGEQYHHWQVFQYLLGYAQLEQFSEYIAFTRRRTQDFIPPKGHAVGRVVELLQVAKNERIVYEMVQQLRAEMEKTLPERFFDGIPFLQGRHDILFDIPVQFSDQHVLVLKVAVDGPGTDIGVLGDQCHGGTVKAVFRNELQGSPYYLVSFVRFRHKSTSFIKKGMNVHSFLVQFWF